MADPEPEEDEQTGKVEINTEDERYRCGFCRKKEIKTNEWGPMYRLDDVVVHYFCLLFSCGLSQNGEDKEGIEGFLLEDIKKEIRRAQRLKCKYCKKNGANVGCAVNKCRASFHFTCGLANGTLSQFLGHYKSYCPTHKPHREIPSTVEDYECITCMSTVTDKESMVWSRCCKTRVFHKECIQSFAYSAGMFHFKCPHCNARKKFKKAMQLSGIFVPERDASWETEPNAFEDLTKVYSTCDADPCLCPDGKDSDGEGEWKLHRCHACGGGAVHQKCGGVKKSKWICNACAPVVHAGVEDDEKDDSANEAVDDALASDEATSSDETESDHIPNPSAFLQTHSESDASSDFSLSQTHMLMNRRRRLVHRRPTISSSNPKIPSIGSFSRESVHGPVRDKVQEFKEKMAAVSKNQSVGGEEFVTTQTSSHDELLPNGTSRDLFSTTVKNAASLSKCENSVAKKLSVPNINHDHDSITKSTLTLPELFKICANPEIRETLRLKILQTVSGNRDEINYQKRENTSKSVHTTVAQSNACSNQHGKNENSVTGNPFSFQVEQHPIEAKICSDDDDVVEIGCKPAPSNKKRSKSATNERTHDSNSHKRRATEASGSHKPHSSPRFKPEHSSNSDVSPTKRKRHVVEITLDEDEDDMADFRSVNNTPRVVASQRGPYLLLDVPFQNCSSASACRESTLSSKPLSSRGINRSENVNFK